MPTLKRLYDEHRHLRWLFVYTLEAHAIDEWPISSSRYNPSGEVVSIRQHRTLDERIHAAKQFQSVYQVPFPLMVDGIDNAFEDVFCTWPFRFYVVSSGLIAYQAQPRNCTYELGPLVEVLEQFSA